MSYNSVPTQKYTLRHIIRRHSDIAKVHNIRIHGLRHSHASLLISMGMNALIEGHEIPREIYNQYGVALPSRMIEELTNVEHGYLEYKEPEIISLKDIKKRNASKGR